MIEVVARLTQGVYLSGETAEVAITFKNPSPPPDAKSQWNDQEEVLAWASAQIHCQCWISPTKVTVPTQHSLTAEESAVTNSLTSFAPCSLESASQSSTSSKASNNQNGSTQASTSSTNNTSGGGSGAGAATSGRIVISTKPTIMFCDLRLLPGESKTYWYREIIPVDGPPSFRGQTVKYAYKLTIGTQRVNAPIKLLRVPLRTLVLQEFTDSTVLNGSASEDIAQPSSSNPFLTDQQDHQEKETQLDSALQVLQIVTSQRNQKFYNVTNARGQVVKFCAFKQAYKLGEDIVGSLDFSECNVPCLQFAVTLQSVEEVTPECRKTEGQKPAISSFSKFHEMCVGYQQSHFVLPIPLHVTPSFYTDLVTLKWRLHFEFVTSTSDENGFSMQPSEKPKKDNLDGQMWQGPTNINIETMVWDLPIKLYPNLPMYISQGLQTQTVFDMQISNSVVLAN